jgi:hypothetical protein
LDGATVDGDGASVSVKRFDGCGCIGIEVTNDVYGICGEAKIIKGTKEDVMVHHVDVMVHHERVES